jgi:hypothetical protein
MKFPSSIWVFFVFLLFGVTPGFGQLTVGGFQPSKNLFPVVGRVSIVAFSDVPKIGILRVTYRPGSAVAHVEDFDMKDGKVSWEPSAAGIVKLAVGSMVPEKEGGEPRTFKEIGSKVISVRSDSSTLGFGIMILAGLILFGGAAFSIRSLLASD